MKKIFKFTFGLSLALIMSLSVLPVTKANASGPQRLCCAEARIGYRTTHGSWKISNRPCGKPEHPSWCCYASRDVYEEKYCDSCGAIWSRTRTGSDYKCAMEAD